MVLEWNEKLALNIPQIDEQHKQLISLIRDLEVADQEGTGGLRVAYVLQELIRYIAVHFSEEERLMMLHNFPGLASHRKEHDFYVMRLKHIQENFRDGDALSKETLDFLKEWISCHIMGTDQIYADFLRGKINGN